MSNIDRGSSSLSEGSGMNKWDEKKYRESSKKKSNEEETRKLSIAPTATLKVNERRVPKTVTDSNFELASDMYVDKGPQLSQIDKGSSLKSSFNSKSSEAHSLSPKSTSSKRNKFRTDHKNHLKNSPYASTNSMGSQFTDVTSDDGSIDPDRSPDYTFFADETIKLSRGITAYKVITPDGFDESQPGSRTIICLHGMMDASYTFEDITEILTTSADGPQARMIVMDFYGHGR
jgi:hypothetical protein